MQREGPAPYHDQQYRQQVERRPRQTDRVVGLATVASRLPVPIVRATQDCTDASGETLNRRGTPPVTVGNALLDLLGNGTGFKPSIFDGGWISNAVPLCSVL